MRTHPFRCGTLMLALLWASALPLCGQHDTTLRLQMQLSDTLRQAGLSLPAWHRPYSRSSVAEDAERTLTYLENHGFPFAEVRLRQPSPQQPDSVEVQIIATPYIRWDSIVLKGDARLSPRFLFPYLKIRRGAPYREQCVTQAAAALNALPYVEMLRPPTPTFTSESAALYLYLNKKNANSFDGYVGFGSNEQGNGISLYGQLLLKLANVTGRGEEFSVDWNRPRPEHQQLRVEGSYPCLFGTPFGLYGQFFLLKSDSSYHRISLPVGFRYLLTGTDFIQMHYRYERTSTTLAAAGQSDCRSDLYGLRFSTLRTDRPRIPHKGYHIDVEGEIGRKTQLESGTHNTVARGSGNAEGFLPFGRRWVQYIRLQSGIILDRQLNTSDLFLLGGLHSLRGLDEQSVTASAYTFLTGELRFFMDRDMFLQAFADGGWYERRGSGEYHRDLPVGLGIGFSFDSKAGLLSLNYAVAAHDGQGFRLRAAKVCVGYSVLF